MVAVAAVNIHVQGHCAVISQSTAGNTPRKSRDIYGSQGYDERDTVQHFGYF